MSAATHSEEIEEHFKAIGSPTRPVGEGWYAVWAAVSDRVQIRVKPGHALESLAHPDLVFNGEPQASVNNLKFHCLSNEREVSGRSDLEARFSADVTTRREELRDRALASIRAAARSGKRKEAIEALLAIGLYMHYQEDCWSHSGWGGIAKYFGHGTFDYPMDAIGWYAWYVHEEEALPSLVESRLIGNDGEVTAALERYEANEAPNRRWSVAVTEILRSVLGTSYGDVENRARRPWRLMNADHPSVRPGQVRSMLRQAFSDLLEFRAAWGTEGRPLIAGVEMEPQIDLLAAGISHRFLLTMPPDLDMRAECVHDLVAHWLYRNATAAQGVTPRGLLGVARGAPRVSADLVNPKLKERIRSCSDVQADWLPSKAAPASDEYLEIPAPLYPKLDAEGNPSVAGDGSYALAKQEDPDE